MPSDTARTSELPGAEPRARRRRRRSASARPSPRRRLRLVYFTVASIWGFLSGCAALLVGLAAARRPLQLDPVVALALVSAAALAVGGGVVASRAYREASRKLR